METAETLLKNGLTDLGYEYSQKQIHAFLKYLAELKKWNRAYNLTALKTDNDIIIKHFLDSVLYLKAIPEETVTLADIGTGAGFPGIPLKIMKPEIEVSLVEPSRKKNTFLRHIIRILEINSGIQVVGKRIENLDKDYEKTFDCIVTRATFKIADFLNIACPYVKNSGRLVLSKGPAVSDEINSLDENIKNHIVQNVSLRFSGNKRNLLVLSCHPASMEN
jgi:16S rRNA (guanine527-N7)-methyltransferase